MKIVLYSDDINLLDYWHKSLDKTPKIVYDIEELERVFNSIIVINYAVLQATNGLLKKLVKKDNRLLVLHRVPSLETAKQLLKVGVFGYGNAMMKEHFLRAAIETIQEGMIWLYPTFTSELIKEIPGTNKNSEDILNRLTSREKEVALLLKEGDTYKQIAEQLDITVRTVKAHASSIYEKLNVPDRLALALLLK